MSKKMHVTCGAYLEMRPHEMACRTCTLADQCEQDGFLPSEASEEEIENLTQTVANRLGLTAHRVDHDRFELR